MRHCIPLIALVSAFSAGCIEDLEQPRPDVIELHPTADPNGPVNEPPLQSTPIVEPDPAVVDPWGDPGWGSGNPDDAPVAPHPDTPGSTHLSTCEIEEAWHTAVASTTIQSTTLASADDGRLVLGADQETGFGVTAYHGETGEPLFALEPNGESLMWGPHWETRLEMEYDAEGAQIHFRPLLEADTLWTIDLAPREQLVTMRIAPSGARILVATCLEQVGIIKSFSSLDGALEKTVTFDECFQLHPFGVNTMVTSFRGDTLVLAHAFGRSIVYVNLGEETIDVLPIDAMLPADAPDDLHRLEILDITMSPNDDAVLMTTNHGQLHRWSLPDLDHTVFPFQVATLDINQRTYMPLSVSPVTFSRDGELVAFVGQDLRVTIMAVADQRIIHTLETPDFGAFDPHGPQSVGNLPVKLRFTDDASSLFVGYTNGMARFQCADRVPPTGRSDLPVRLEGPPRAVVGEEITLTATHLAGRSLHGHAFYLDGELMAEPTTGREVVWTPSEPGEFTIEVRVMDGRNSGGTRHQIWVETAE